MYRTHNAIGARTLPETYFDVRYEVLRAPLGIPRGAERLEDDSAALHVWITDKTGDVVSVGRVHVTNHTRNEVQVRMMATRLSHAGNGLGRKVLEALEQLAKTQFGAKHAWLNARDGAVGFYAACGWIATNYKFNIDGIGPHTRMVRELHTSTGI